MDTVSVAQPVPVPEARPRRLRRTLLWGALVALLLVAQSLLVLLTVAFESSRAQEHTDAVATDAAAEVRRDVSQAVQELQALTWNDILGSAWSDRARALMQVRRAVLRIERRSSALQVLEAAESPFGPPLFARLTRAELDVETELACGAAQRDAAPVFSRSYFVPLAAGVGLEVMDLCLPVQAAGRAAGYTLVTFGLGALLDTALTPQPARRHEISFVEPDGARLARSGSPRGAGVYVAERVVDLPGQSLLLRADSAAGRPSLIPNLTLALVLGLSIALFGVVLLLARDVRRRAQAEGALADALAFRRAMENSLLAGLRARDLSGRITYVNPAFCRMVGWRADELGHGSVPPYWPPEQVNEYARRQAARLASGAPEVPSREGFETVFMRKSGERFPVMIYEAPLIDGQGRQTGWMSAVVDISEQRRVEDLWRQQQERLQASARLATVGEMASLLSHELNQPLSAIASYASGSLNLIEPAEATLSAAPPAQTTAQLRQALLRIAEQAERAGRVIKSVHDFVRRREQQHEAVGADQLFESVLPLVRLQARKSGTRVDVDLPAPAPRVRCDRTMVEQVLLNLARNGIQAMEVHTPPERRVLTLRARQTHPRWVTFSLTDAGVGIPRDVAARLFTPFFSTRHEGMGLGLSLCRTVIEQHGGALDFESPFPGSAGAASAGTQFRFTLPAVTDPAAPPKPDDPTP
jgi:two-component system, LuxR family, sensor histidine kinase DctS